MISFLVEVGPIFFFRISVFYSAELNTRMRGVFGPDSFFLFSFVDDYIIVFCRRRRVALSIVVVPLCSCFFKRFIYTCLTESVHSMQSIYVVLLVQ